MRFIEKIFFQTHMSWKFVLFLSVMCGVIPELLMIPTFFENTSFRQPGISFEFWILMTMFIVLNCEKPLEAGIKTFALFLISQP